MASGAGSSSLKVATFAFVCIMLVVSSSAAPKKLMCRECDKMCSSSTDGCTSSFCSGACGDAASPGCLSCKQAYYSKCKNLCMSSCLANCVES
ncbi:hypothetical protein SEVIR_7G175400v4 [Setaria viridis]|uniref:Kazal-like domain-containing protein n=2 Tax=Setaria TaxID=4554 RepID=K3YDS2_SETIT|nr:hypothetical protein SETIT_7G166300v2 [Setaria italica]TKW05438.1 hypothetical protein SEVIR_7G175400v2 [Setaria viridis]